jgi:hypothetical protein
MKKIHEIIICLFLFVVYIQSLFYLTAEKQEISENENRVLAKFPVFNAQNYFSGKFSREFENYFNDRFPFRDDYMEIARDFSRFYYVEIFDGFNKKEIATAFSPQREIPETPETPEAPPAKTEAPPQAERLTSVFALDNRLFEEYVFSEESAQKYAAAINALYEDCGRPPTYVLNPPAPAQLYYAGALDEKSSPRSVHEFLKSNINGPEVIDLTEIYENAKDEYVYFKTDHHWTARGAHYAYRAFAEAIGGASGGFEPSGAREGFLGSLYKSIKNYPQSEKFLNDSDIVEYFTPAAESFIGYDNAALVNGVEGKIINPDYDSSSNLYLTFFGKDFPIVYIESSVANGKSVLLVRDSYGLALAPYLAGSFERVYSADLRYFNADGQDFILGDFFQEQNIDCLAFVNYSLHATGVYWVNWGDELLKAVKR